MLAIPSIHKTMHTYDLDLGQNTAIKVNHPDMWNMCIIANRIILRQNKI